VCKGHQNPGIECAAVEGRVMSEARFKMALGDATMEIEGDPSFVDAQLQKFAASICLRLAPNEPAAAGEPIAAAEPAAGTEEPNLTGIFALSERGAVRILVDVPGRGRRARMRNTVKLLAYAAERLQNRRAVPFGEVKAACQAQRCYDRTNLGTALKRERATFVLGGYRRKQTIALTPSGRARPTR